MFRVNFGPSQVLTEIPAAYEAGVFTIKLKALNIIVSMAGFDPAPSILSVWFSTVALRRDIHKEKGIQPRIILAESEGFEPSGLYRPDALAVRWFKPLTQLSIAPRLKTKSNKTKQISNESTVYEGSSGGGRSSTHLPRRMPLISSQAR